MNDVRDSTSTRVSPDFLIELALATDALLEAEDVGPLEADWTLIEADATVAVEARAFLRRRMRWAREFERHMATFRRLTGSAWRDLVAMLPDGCFEGDGEGLFTVPLSSLIPDARQAVERLMMMPYDDETFRLDLFFKLREQLATNYVVASGFVPTTNPHEVEDRLVLPTRHKSGNPSELVDLYLAHTPFQRVLSFPMPFHIPTEARFEHAHIIGGTGHGKTQLLQQMIHADLTAAKADGRSVVVIDSQGDLIRKLVRIDLFDPDDPHSLADRLILIDPSDVEFPPSLNLFDMPAERLRHYSPADRERALNGLIELYETFFGELLGSELTQKQGVIFRYLARLMLAIPNATIHTLMQLMEDGKPFREHMRGLEGSARYFFETEFFHPSFAATKKQILKRLWGVLSTPAFERMFAQKDNKLDLFEAINSGSIVLISTAKDLLKTEGSALFGRFFIAMLAQATLERSVLPSDERTPTFLYVDEAQEYFDDTIETILTQARKYKVAITAAHQTLDQLSPRLRSAFLANTSLKCAGGVSAKDARALASELHTDPSFIEGMRKRREETEFAVWLKHRTSSALTLRVPLGHLERQPTLMEDQYDELIGRNRARYCGTLADVLPFALPVGPSAPPPSVRIPPTPPEAEQPIPSPPIEPAAPLASAAPSAIARPTPPVEYRELGKGGPKHRYLQSLIKELGEQHGFRATIEAPLQGAVGQVDVLLTRETVEAAFEVSVSTPVEQERGNLRKCLAAGFEHIALILAKSKATQGRYAAQVLEGLTNEDRGRISILTPEEIPDYIAALAPPPSPSETLVKGYRVRVSHTQLSPEDAKQRRARIAKVVARSLKE